MKNLQDGGQGDDENRSFERESSLWKFCRHYCLWILFFIFLVCGWFVIPEPIIQFVCHIKEHIEKIASAITILLGVIALNEYCEYYKKRLRLRGFLDHCDKISERISSVLETCSDSGISSKVKYDVVIKDLKIILNDKEKGLDILNETFVASKISKLMDIGVSVNELMVLKNGFKEEFKTMKEGIDDLIKKRNDEPEGSPQRAGADADLNKAYDIFNETIVIGLIIVNDEIRRIYNKMATMFKVPI